MERTPSPAPTRFFLAILALPFLSYPGGTCVTDEEVTLQDVTGDDLLDFLGVTDDSATYDDEGPVLVPRVCAPAFARAPSLPA